MKVGITRRPITVSTQAPAAIIEEMLARIAAIRGRASEWGVVNDATLAEALAGDSVEADFTRGYFRDRFVESSSPALLPGWSFSRIGAGTARTAGGQVSSFATGAPRITDAGLLMEMAATNLVGNSEDLSTSVSVSQATLTENVALRPNGQTTGATWTRTGPEGLSSFFATTAVGAVSAAIDLKPNVGSEVAMQITDLSTGFLACVIDLATGVVEQSSASGTYSAVTVHVTPLADGWKRVNLSGIKASGADPTSYAVVTPVLGTNVIHMAAPQINQGPPSSYIPTTGAAATRGADVASITSPIFASGGTMMVEFENPIAAAATRTALGTSGGGQLYLYSAAALVFQAPANLAAPGSASPTGGVSRLAVTWAPGSRSAVLNGGAVATDTVPINSAATLALGSMAGTDQLQANIRRFIAFGTHFTNAQLQALTS